MPLDDQEFGSPGELIGTLLSRVGWTQTVLATVLGIEQPVLSRVIANKRSVDAVLALRLGEAFATPAEVFLRAQSAYDLSRARAAVQGDPKRSMRAQALATFPVPEMIARGWIDADMRNLDQVEDELVRFFGAKSLDDIEEISHAAKKTNATGAVTPQQSAWLHRARAIASELIVPRYSPALVRSAIAQLSELRRTATDVHHVPRILAEAGVRFVVVESLTAAKIDGACFWLNDMSPVIAMTIRFDRIDNFWFVLRHECEHVLRGHGREFAMLDVELERTSAGSGGDLIEAERMANEAASDFCVPQLAMEKFYSKKSPFFAERDILGFAATMNVHPGLVVGQLQHMMGRFDRHRKHLAKIRESVLPSAAVDGWGNVYPLDN